MATASVTPPSSGTTSSTLSSSPPLSFLLGSTLASATKAPPPSQASSRTEVIEQRLSNQTGERSAAQKELSRIKPMWDTAKEQPSCSRCGAEFSFFKRRHQCRCCYHQMCDACCSLRQRMPGHSEELVRVCEVCSQHSSRSDTACIARTLPYLYENEDLQTRTLTEIYELLRSDKDKIKDALSIGLPLVVLNFLFSESRPVQRACMRLVAKMAEDVRAATALIGEKNIVRAIIHVLSTGEDEARAYTASLLEQLARRDGGIELIIPALAPLVACIQSSHNQTMHEAGLATLRLLADHPEANIHLQQAGGIQCVIALLSSSSAFSVLEAAADIIQRWCSKDSMRRSIIEAGGARALVVSLAGHPSIQSYALIALSELAGDSNGGVAIACEGGIAALLLRLPTAEEWAKERIVRILIALASNGNISDIIIDQVKEGLPTMTSLLDSRSPRLSQQGLSFLSVIVEQPNIRERLGASGVIEAAVCLLTSKDERLRIQTLAFIARVAGEENSAIVLINCGGVREIVSLLATSEQNLRVATIGALAALSAAGSERIAAAIAAVGGIGALVPLLAFPSVGQAYAACALANLCAHLICREGFHLANGVQHVPSLLASSRAEVQMQALRLLVSLSNEPKMRARAGGCVPPLIALLSAVDWNSSDADLMEHATTVLLQLVQDSPSNFSLVLSHKGLSCTLQLLHSPRPPVARAAAHLLALLTQDEHMRVDICQEKTIIRLVEMLLQPGEQEDLNVEEDVCCVISRLPLQDHEATILHAAGGVHALTARISPGINRNTRRYALVALTNLALFPIPRSAMLHAQVLSYILGFTQDSDAVDRQQAISTLFLLSDDPTFASALHEARGFNEVVNLLLTMASMQSVVKEELIQILLRVCEQDASAWNTFVEMASIKGLLLLAASPNTVAQRKTALELRNMASQVLKAAISAKLVEDGAGAALVELLCSCSDVEAREAACEALAYLSPSELRVCELLLEFGSSASLVLMLKSSRISTRNAALINLAFLTNNADGARSLRVEGLLPVLHDTLSGFGTESSVDWSALRHASITLRNFLAADAEHISDLLSLPVTSPTLASSLVSLLHFITQAAIANQGNLSEELNQIEDALADCLDRLCSMAEGRKAMLECRELFEVLRALLRPGRTSPFLPSTALSTAEYLSRETSFLCSFDSSGLAEALVEFVSDLRTLKCLSRSALWSQSNRRAIMNANSPAVLIPLMLSNEDALEEVQELATQIIACLSAERTNCAALISTNAVPALLHQLQSVHSRTVLHAATAVAHLALSPEGSLALAVEGRVDALASILPNTEADVACSLITAFAHLVIHEDLLREFVSGRLCTELLAIISCTEPREIELLVRTLELIADIVAYGGEAAAERLCGDGIVSRLVALLSSGAPGGRIPLDSDAAAPLFVSIMHILYALALCDKKGREDVHEAVGALLHSWLSAPLPRGVERTTRLTARAALRLAYALGLSLAVHTYIPA